LLIVPAAVPPGETPSPDELFPPLGAQRPHPECGSRNSRDNSLILVITRVEAGDRARPCRSARNGAVGRLWVVSGVLLSTRGHLDGCAPGRRAVHLLSPGYPRPVPRSCPGPWPGGAPGPWFGGSAHVRRVYTLAGGPGGPGAVGRRNGTGPAQVTSGQLTHARSPQAVHIPGDNFSTCRPWSPFESAPSRVIARTGPPGVPAQSVVDRCRGRPCWRLLRSPVTSPLTSPTDEPGS
jgi:hypothetical protein